MQNLQYEMHIRNVRDGVGERRGDVHTNAVINTRFAFCILHFAF
jgi:hypothetical protein